MAKALRGFHAHVADMLGGTEAQLDYLIGLKAGIHRLRGTEGVVTDAKGWTDHNGDSGRRALTDAGLEIVRRARDLGY